MRWIATAGRPCRAARRLLQATKLKDNPVRSTSRHWQSVRACVAGALALRSEHVSRIQLRRITNGPDHP